MFCCFCIYLTIGFRIFATFSQVLLWFIHSILKPVQGFEDSLNKPMNALALGLELTKLLLLTLKLNYSDLWENFMIT